MGGEMTYARNNGESLFRVALPFPASEPPPLPLSAAPSRALSILLVEDDPISREVTAALLRAVGHQVEAAADEDEALARALGQAFDLILLDIDLGRGGSGLALARRLRVELDVASAIVALTGSDVPASAAADLDGVIVKPLDADIDLSGFLTAGAAKRR
jgi:CheY-like chemotaxis protein